MARRPFRRRSRVGRHRTGAVASMHFLPCTPCVLPIQNKLPYRAQKKSFMEQRVLKDPHRRRESLVIQIPYWHPSITSFKSRFPETVYPSDGGRESLGILLVYLPVFKNKLMHVAYQKHVSQI